MMQMTMDMPRPGLWLAFAHRGGSGYVMRSEKRPAYSGGDGNSPRRRKPRRRRPSALYIIMTVLVSIILWPIGMVLLWRRKVRLQPGTKLLMSLLTLCLSVFLIVFLLTVPVDNARVTAAQDAANDWLDKAYGQIAVVGDAAWHKGVETWNAMYSFGQKAFQPVTATVADGLEKGVELAGSARDGLIGLFGRHDDAPESVAHTLEPAPTASAVLEIHIPGETPDPGESTPLSAGLLTADGEFHIGETPEPTRIEALPTVKPQAVVTPIPAQRLEKEAADGDGTEPVQDEALADDAGTEAASNAAQAADAPAEATAEPEPTFQPLAAGGATVYYAPDGERYHMIPDCGGMTGAEAHTLKEAVDAGKQCCDTCGSPDAAILSFSFVAWVDEAGLYHTSANCEAFTGQWQLMPLNNAITGGYAPCAACQAELYAQRFGTVKPAAAAEAKAGEEAAAEEAPAGEDPSDSTEAPVESSDAEAESPDAEADESDAKPEADAEVSPEREGAENDAAAEQSASDVPSDAAVPTDAPTDATPSPTDSSAVTAIQPATALKSAGEATVYHSSNGKFYHAVEICKGMTASNPYKLSDIQGHYRRCATCDAPDESLIGQPCLWMDENGLCHTSDECASFQGAFRLIPRDDALAQALEGCKACGADEYLIPNTILADVE